MVRALFNGEVIAEADAYEDVEGNVYFPPATVNDKYLDESSTTSTCPWKGQASYYDVVVDGERITDAAWYYPDPKPDASYIKDHIAFYTDKVTVEEE
jgi:uncharacterized protein (DUF427 family)